MSDIQILKEILTQTIEHVKSLKVLYSKLHSDVYKEKLKEEINCQLVIIGTLNLDINILTSEKIESFEVKEENIIEIFESKEENNIEHFEVKEENIIEHFEVKEENISEHFEVKEETKKLKTSLEEEFNVDSLEESFKKEINKQSEKDIKKDDLSDHQSENEFIEVKKRKNKNIKISHKVWNVEIKPFMYFERYINSKGEISNIEFIHEEKNGNLYYLGGKKNPKFIGDDNLLYILDKNEHFVYARDWNGNVLTWIEVE